MSATGATPPGKKAPGTVGTNAGTLKQVTVKEYAPGVALSKRKEKEKVVADIRKALGDEAVLLKVAPLGKNPIEKRWQKIGIEKMADADYLASLCDNCNIGVLLGKQSAGLCTLDIDDEGEVNWFIWHNPHLEDTLQTSRVRGANFWLQIDGTYPASGTIENQAGKHIGEWRSTGNQTVIDGAAIDQKKGETKPTKYRRISKATRPVRLQFTEIIWPDEWQLPWNAVGAAKESKADQQYNEKPEGVESIDYLCPQDPEITLAIAREVLFTNGPDCVYDDWLKCAAALKHQFSPQQDAEAYELFNEWSSTGTKYKDKRETRAKWDSLKQTPTGRRPVTIGTLLNMAKEQGWTGKIGVEPFGKSQSSDFPKPMADAAFYGVAGEIVRLIEPHTEADPAALLFQFLAGFGSIIGRDAYTMADGSKHCLTLFGVLVGVSSKGRKGTSWNQIANPLRRVDEDWHNNRVKSGLSSGEGLIWNVRDPISETKPVKENGRHTGESEQVITDAGISDKRLFVIEGEFANVLKVMTREGNTLSPVIRAAWDSGTLRTLTKNSPAEATEAHISIIGHITRDELRRLLNETEAANGFANRFCWLAVRRSKCLPEGGQIHTVNFDDVAMRLQSAIEFSRNVGEVTRSEAARELWRNAYPDLSEGKPGLLGAVTGRAEAQVMRLSAIYALLDQSSVIEPAHHHAAMALWNYCEQSARWIFDTSTGDKNADRILAVLREAGKSGMTRTEISKRVFNGNLSGNILADTLRVLNEAGYATVTKEPTAGAPSERWFSSGGGTNLTK